MLQDHKIYTLSPGDIAVMQEAKVTLQELARSVPKYEGMPHLWSRLPYLMLFHVGEHSSRHFWKEYRAFDDLLKTRDRHYRRSLIPKNSGGTRELLVPDGALQRHQRFIQTRILNNIPVSEHACAYRRQRGLIHLASPHIGHEVLIHVDIRDFFSSITEEMVFDALRRETGYPRNVAGYLSRLCCYKRRLPQGACTSPALSNICFKGCDGELADLAKEKGMAYTRYSDDLYFSGDGVDAKAVIREVSDILEAYGFHINSRKTRILGQHQAQKVTAIVVNDKMQVTRDYRRKLRQELHYLRRFGEGARAALEAVTYETYLHQLLGRVTFVLYADPENKEFTEAKAMLEDLIDQVRYGGLPF